MSALKLKLFDAIDFLIQVESGPDKGRVYRIRPPKIMIGRDPKSQIVMTDPKVSREQCLIQFGQDIVCLDLSSRKTTFINGNPCHNSKLKPGDVITFGDTSLKFITRTRPEAKPQLLGADPNQMGRSLDSDAGKKRFQQFLVVVVLLALGLFLLQEEPIENKKTELLTQEAVNKQINESRERMSQIRDSKEEKMKLSQQKYLFDVETHFVSGFRDFQNGQYGRAIDSFGTTIATDQNHSRAKQYARTAKKMRGDLIDTHMRDGSRYREKMMYKRCAAEFEKAIVLINDVNSDRFRLGKTQLEECRMLQGSY